MAPLTPSATVVWFRRDLRTADHPALAKAAAAGVPVVALFVVDPALTRPSGAARLAFLWRCLRDLRASGVPLVIRTGDPARVVPAVAAEAGADTVHVSADFAPYGRRTRDAAVSHALHEDGRRLVATGSPYAVDPGTVRKADGTPFKVFTPFSRVWTPLATAAAPAATPEPSQIDWHTGLPSEEIPADPDPSTVPPHLPAAGERAAHDRLDAFLSDPETGVRHYHERRNDPGADATSRLSPYLKFGCLHPRQVLAQLPDGTGPDVLRSELCWREFYADVLWHAPASAHAALQPHMDAMRVDEGPDADERFAAWAEGRTGFPFVDAGMRQLRAEGWMHNRVRMAVASFLVKDLHLDWRRGARHFMDWLVDGDLASNQHGWQWTAGTGTDAAPYFRVFNPTSQGEKFDPDGTYVRRYVPELAAAALPAARIHEPGPVLGYQAPIVDHAAERAEALARYAEVKGRAGTAR